VEDLKTFGLLVGTANNALHLASNAGLIKWFARRMDPLNIPEFKFPAETFTPKILGNMYTVNLTFANISISGLDSMTIYPTKIAGPTTLELGGVMSNFVVNHIVYVLDIQQQSWTFRGRKFCRTWRFWKECPVSFMHDFTDTRTDHLLI
jgi:hypothetical protein